MEGEGAGIREFGKRVQYSALSYSWGEPVFCWPLVVNGFTYPITENLFRALWRMRDERDRRFLWVDALCIKQHDNGEKSQQLGTMLRIFEKAKAVEIWLGEHSEHSALVFGYLKLVPPDSLQNDSSSSEGGLLSSLLYSNEGSDPTDGYSR